MSFLSPAFLVLALPFCTLSASIPNPAPNPAPDDAIRFVLAAIPASYALQPPPSPDGPSVIAAHLQLAQRTFVARRLDDLEIVSRRLCDVYSEYWYRDLAEELLPRVFGQRLEQQRWRRQMMVILKEISEELNYAETSTLFLAFLASLNRFDWVQAREFDAKFKVLPNKMFTMLLYDRLYAALQEKLEEAMGQQRDQIEEMGSFALKWLKQMRKTISVRYEIEMAQLREMYGKRKRELEKIVQEKMESGRDGEVEEIKQYGAGMMERVNRLGGVGTPLHRVVREQIKLSLMNDTLIFLTNVWNRGDLLLNDSYAGFGNSWVLSEFLMQYRSVDTDVRRHFCPYLTKKGFKQIDKDLIKISADPDQSWYGLSLQRTLRLIRPKLEAEMGPAWEYGRMIGHFGDKFAESKRQIDTVTALVLYRNLYESLAEQLAAGTEDLADPSATITFGPFMSPEEYTAYWLSQMVQLLGQELVAAREKLAEQLARDREMMVRGKSVQIEEAREAEIRNRKLSKNLSLKMKSPRKLTKSWSWNQLRRVWSQGEMAKGLGEDGVEEIQKKPESEMPKTKETEPELGRLVEFNQILIRSLIMVQGQN